MGRTIFSSSASDFVHSTYITFRVCACGELVLHFGCEFVLRRSHSHRRGNGLSCRSEGAKLTEHEGNHKAPNCLLIPAGSLANHYTSSSHLFSTFYSLLYIHPLLLLLLLLLLLFLTPVSHLPLRIASPFLCECDSLCVCVFGSENKCGCEKRKSERVCVCVCVCVCSQNYLA